MPMLFWFPAIIAAEMWCMAFAGMPSLTFPLSLRLCRSE
jgi:hypothetical protein